MSLRIARFRWLSSAVWIALAGTLSGAQVTEFALPTPNGGPRQITVGPDGNLWFVAEDSNVVGRITTAGVITEFPIPTPNSSPFAITAGPDGNLWFTETFGNKIGRMTPAGVFTEFPIPTPQSGPFDITAGPDGNLWFTESFVWKIGRITPTGSITEYPVPFDLAFPYAITSGPDGNLWFTCPPGHVIVRMTTQGAMTGFQLPGLSFAYDIVSGPEGALWFTDYYRYIGRIRVDGQITRFPLPAQFDPRAITTGPDGAIWFTQSLGRVVERSPLLGERVYETGGTSEWGFIVAGPDGAMWFTKPDDNTIVRLDFGPVVVNDAGDQLHAAGCAATGAGTCTLRDALTWSGANPGPETIHFAIPGPGVHTISPTSALPPIGDLILDATTQPGYAGQPLIELSGVSAGSGTQGFFVNDGSAAIRGFVINRFEGDGILLQAPAANSVIQANWIGTTATGIAAASNGTGGIRLESTAGNTVGGGATGLRNVISGNGGYGILLRFSPRNRVLGNYIGVDRTGAAALGNAGIGVSIAEASDNEIGDLTSVPGTPPGNVVSGNHGEGMQVFVFSGSATSRSFVKGNLIGTNAAGTAALGNGAAGVLLRGSADCVIGGSTPGGRNIISGNRVGVEIGILSLVPTRRNVVSDNFIGTDVSGSLPIPNQTCGVLLSGANTIQNRIGEPFVANRIAFNTSSGICSAEGTGPAVDNTFSGNEIHSNGGLAIDLFPFGVTANDPCDTDNGSNRLQNFPILSAVSAGPGTMIVRGTLEGAASTTYRLEFFRNTVCDPSGFGEGERYLFSASVTTDSSCRTSFDIVIPITLDPTSLITATATDPAGNTSEFSPCVSAATDFFTLPPCRVADTRDPAGPHGGPALGAGAVRTYTITGRCGIPVSARAIAANVTVTGAQSAGHVTVFPAGEGIPASSTINYGAAQTRANNAILALNGAGRLDVHCAQGSGTVDFVLDVVGYFE